MPKPIARSKTRKSVAKRFKITARGKVREEITEGARRRILLDVWAEKADGTKAVVGTASALR